MHAFKVSQTVFPGAELELTLRLSTPGLATFLGTEQPLSQPLTESAVDLEPLRRYVEQIARGLPELIDEAGQILIEHQIHQLTRQNKQSNEQLNRKG